MTLTIDPSDKPAQCARCKAVSRGDVGLTRCDNCLDMFCDGVCRDEHANCNPAPIARRNALNRRTSGVATLGEVADYNRRK